VREGTGTPVLVPVPSAHKAGCATTGHMHQEWSPVMPLDRMPSINLSIIVPAGAAYDGHHHWWDSDGGLNASVRFEVGGYSAGHVQGKPAALRELAAALISAADQADAAHPTAEAAAS
jgi:hypothetical protein